MGLHFLFELGQGSKGRSPEEGNAGLVRIEPAEQEIDICQGEGAATAITGGAGVGSGTAGADAEGTGGDGTDGPASRGDRFDAQ